MAATPVAVGEKLSVTTPDGLTLSARVYGNPSHPAILMVHGLGQSRLSWDRQIARALVQNFRVVTFDLRGHGDSSKPTEVAAYADNARWADDVNAVIKAAGLKRPTIVGWSLGGMIIGSYLAKYGNGDVGGVVLVDAMTKMDMTLLSEKSLEYVQQMASDDVAARAAAIPRFLALCFAAQPPKDDFERMLAYDGMVPGVVNAGALGLSDKGFDQAFQSLPRVLVIHGRNDGLIKLAMAERMPALNPQAKLSVFENSAHAPFYEEPERFNRELAAFVAR